MKWLVIRAMTPHRVSIGFRPSDYAYARGCAASAIKVREMPSRPYARDSGTAVVTAARQSDTVLRLIEMRIAEIWSWAHAVARRASSHLPEEVACELARVMDDSASRMSV